eukprot:746116-Hanusia_phi.AAC.2
MARIYGEHALRSTVPANVGEHQLETCLLTSENETLMISSTSMEESVTSNSRTRSAVCSDLHAALSLTYALCVCTDGVMFEGARLRVEMSRGTAATYGYDKRGGGGGAGKAPPRNLRRSDYRVGGSFGSQQCADGAGQPRGRISKTTSDKLGGGIVEFANEDDRDYAIKKFDDTEFSNPFDRGYIRVMKPRCVRVRWPAAKK